MAVRAHVYVSGRVQGVYFREETRRLAQSLGVAGWVRNRADGRVEATLEGEDGAVRRLIDWCHRGPTLARVREVAVEWGQPTGEFGEFAVASTHQGGE